MRSRRLLVQCFFGTKILFLASYFLLVMLCAIAFTPLGAAQSILPVNLNTRERRPDTNQIPQACHTHVTSVLSMIFFPIKPALKAVGGLD